MKRCIKCVIPETFPQISFSDTGECNLCKKHDPVNSNIPSKEKLLNKFQQLLENAKGSNSKYDALVAYSGGKDSTYLLHILKNEFKLNVLALTFDNGFISKQSFKNIDNVLNNIGIDHYTYKPNYHVIKKIFYQCLDEDIYPEYLIKFGSQVCISCIRMVNNASLRTALEKQIPLVMLGNSPGQLIQSENEIIYKDNVIPYQLRKNLFKTLAEKVGDEVYQYLMLDKHEYNTKNFPYIVNCFPLIGYDEDKIYSTIKNFGWERPSDVDPNSSNCLLNSLGITKHVEKYGFHPYDFEMSTLVRLGTITREEAMRRVNDLEPNVLKTADDVKTILES